MTYFRPQSSKVKTENSKWKTGKWKIKTHSIHSHLDQVVTISWMFTAMHKMALSWMDGRQYDLTHICLGSKEVCRQFNSWNRADWNMIVLLIALHECFLSINIKTGEGRPILGQGDNPENTKPPYHPFFLGKSLS